jgi:hypothetical protein
MNEAHLNWPPDVGDEAVRRSLGPTALEFFIRIMHVWQVPIIESRQLLGVAQGTRIENLKLGKLSEEQFLRISYLIGIYQALHICRGEKLADRWVGCRNTNVMFAGRSPLEYMARGGLDAMSNVRRLVDAWCAEN